MQEIKCRVAPSLGGGFAGTPEQVWGTQPYNPDTDIEKPCLFFGLYGVPDFYSLWRHKGKKWVLWAGSDIRHLINGYWLDDTEWGAKLLPAPLAEWINRNCENWVENNVERDALLSVGIKSFVCPSFLGNINGYEMCFKPSDTPKLYTSVSGDDFTLYGWDKIDGLAEENPDTEFLLYGNTKEWKSTQKNVIVHGRVPQEQMNKEIRETQGALRLTEFDGFSEILAKSILWGQYPVSLIAYPGMFTPDQIRWVGTMKKPNERARNYYLSILNKYPWAK